MSRRPRLSPRVEALEARTVLSATPGLAAAAAALLNVHTRAVVAPIGTNLALQVTASQAVYHAGQPVRLTITETNTGSQPVGVMAYGPESLIVTRNGKPVWRSPIVPVPMLEMLLPPGQSRTLTAVWPGGFNVNRGLPHGGTFTITVRQDNTTAAVSIKVVHA